MTGFSSRFAWWLFAFSMVLFGGGAYVADRSTAPKLRPDWSSAGPAQAGEES